MSQDNTPLTLRWNVVETVEAYGDFVRGELVNVSEKRKLIKFCETHNIDPQEIDDSLSYSEAFEHLRNFVVQELDDAEMRAMMEQYEAFAIEERYGVKEWTEDKPLILIKAWLRINYRFRVKNAKNNSSYGWTLRRANQLIK